MVFLTGFEPVSVPYKETAKPYSAIGKLVVENWWGY